MCCEIKSKKKYVLFLYCYKSIQRVMSAVFCVCVLVPKPNYHNFEPEANKHFWFSNLHYKPSFLYSAMMYLIIYEIKK